MIALVAYPHIVISQTQGIEYNSLVSKDTPTNALVGAVVQKETSTSGTGFRNPVLSNEVLCSCVKGVRHFIPTMPYGDANYVFSNSELFIGAVAIFWFPPSEKYPKGTKHVAYVSEIEGDKFYIKQTNKETCAYSEEWVSMDDEFLLGFYNPALDILSQK